MVKQSLQTDFDNYIAGDEPSFRLSPYIKYFKAHHHIILRRREIIDFSRDDFKFLHKEFLLWLELVSNYDMSFFYIENKK